MSARLPAEDGRLDGGAVSDVSGGRRLLTARERVAIAAVVVAGVGLVALWPADRNPGQAGRENAAPVAEAGRGVPYRPMPVPEAPPEAPAPVMAAVRPGTAPSFMPLPSGPSGGGGARPIPSPILSYEDRGAGGGAAPSAPGGASGASAPAPAEDALGGRLRPSRLQPARATALRHPDLTVPMGARIPCLPETPVDSTVAGFFSCVVPVDVRGATGAVVLMERGTRIVGEVRAAMARGSRRLFVVMTSALTPHGVEVALDSPGADALGQAGLDGEVDAHFFERFRGAMLLAFLDTGLQAAAVAASAALASEGRTGGGVSLFQFQGGARQAGAAALDSDINIPPTLRRNQAEPMTVFVARHLDFSDVYRLRAARP